MAIISNQKLLKKESDKNRILGPVLIPNKLIYRNPNKAVSEPHYIRFSEDTIEELRSRFHNNNFDNSVNINHDGVQIKEVSLSKSFIVTLENICDLPPEFKSLPIGTWMAEYIVDNKEVWKMIKKRKLNGFSIEGLFGYGEIINKKTIYRNTNEAKTLEQRFDNLLFQIKKGNTHEKIEKGSYFFDFDQVKEWKSKFGFSFRIYGGEHFIENNPHFHFENNEKGISCKVGFNGDIFECIRNKSIPRNILKELKYFLKQTDTKKLLTRMWNEKNPEFII